MLKAILVCDMSTGALGVREDGGAGYLSCIFSKMGTIMSNLGLLAGSSFIQILMSLQMWGEIPGGIVGRRPSRATCSHRGQA